MQTISGDAGRSLAKIIHCDARGRGDAAQSNMRPTRSLFEAGPHRACLEFGWHCRPAAKKMSACLCGVSRRPPVDPESEISIHFVPPLSEISPWCVRIRRGEGSSLCSSLKSQREGLALQPRTPKGSRCISVSQPAEIQRRHSKSGQDIRDKKTTTKKTCQRVKRFSAQMSWLMDTLFNEKERKKTLTPLCFYLALPSSINTVPQHAMLKLSCQPLETGSSPEPLSLSSPCRWAPVVTSRNGGCKTIKKNK